MASSTQNRYYIHVYTFVYKNRYYIHVYTFVYTYTHIWEFLKIKAALFGVPYIFVYIYIYVHTYRGFSRLGVPFGGL